jgi:benzoyl-CoA reductase subunit BamB
MRREDEKPPANHWKKRFPELEKELLDAYYRFKGWNEDGIPTVESLRELGLDYVADEFVSRGILGDEKTAGSSIAAAAPGDAARSVE